MTKDQTVQFRNDIYDQDEQLLEATAEEAAFFNQAGQSSVDGASGAVARRHPLLPGAATSRGDPVRALSGNKIFEDYGLIAALCKSDTRARR